MSKYTIKTYDASSINSTDLYSRLCIANELAEANRLKRLELQDKLKGENESVDWDLSDKA